MKKYVIKRKKIRVINREFSAILQDFGFIFVPADFLVEAFSDSKTQGLVIMCTKEIAYNLLRLGVVFSNPSGLFFFLYLLISHEVIIDIYNLSESGITSLINLELDDDLQVYHLVDDEVNEDFYFIPYVLDNKSIKPSIKHNRILQKINHDN